MECEICFESYDHSIHKPHTLMPCSHTFCIKCIKLLNENVCPKDRIVLQDHKPNYELLKLIPTSGYDKLIPKLFSALKRVNDLDEYLNESRKKRVESNQKIMDSMRNLINERTNYFIGIIQEQRKKLMNQIENIENYLDKKIYEYKSLDKAKLNEIKIKLENGDLDIRSLNTMVNQLEDELVNMQDKISEINELKSDNYKFDEANFSKTNFLGEITNKKWIINEETADEYIRIGFAIGEELQDHKRGLEYLNKSIQLEPNYSSSYCKKGFYLLKSKQHAGAIECFDKAIEINPDYGNAYTGKGIVEYEQNNLTKAIEFFNIAIQLDSSSYLPHFNKGLCLLKQKKIDNALHFLKTALIMEPNNKDILEKIEQVEELNKKI